MFARPSVNPMLLLALAVAASCTTLAYAGHGASLGSRDVLSPEEIPSAYTNVLDAIQHVRPEFLAVRTSSTGTSTPNLPSVYLDGHRLADVGLLRLVPTSWIAQVQLVRGPLPGKRYGSDHAERAIFVTTRPATP